MNDKQRSPRAGWWMLALLVPLGIFVVTQLDFAQNADGALISGLPWRIGEWEIIADIFAPAWAVSIMVMAAFNRRLLDRYPGDVDYQPRSWFGRRFATADWVRQSTWIATGGAILIILLSWTREWARFGEQPEAFWYVLVIVGTLALTAVPLWWVRHDLHRAAERRIGESKFAAAVDQWLFPTDDGPRRWPQAMALAAITVAGVLVVQGQLDALLRGMRPAGSASAGLGSLARVFEFDLSIKLGQVTEAVGAWFAYGELVGDAFASAFGVVLTSLAIDTFLLIPAYTALIALLLLRARRFPPIDPDTSQRRTYDILIVAGFVVLAGVAIADLVENAMTWRILDRFWTDPALVDSWHVRVLWFAAFFKTIGLALLAISGILVLALRRQRFAGIFQSLIAVRGELLVLAMVGAALVLMPQTADVIRRWNVSVTLLTVVFAIALAMLLQFTSSRTLSALRRDARRAAAGEELEPARIRLWSPRPMLVRRAVVGLVFVLAGLQMVVIVLLGWPVGLGFLIPAALIAILWFFGIPIPEAGFERGDRTIPDETRRVLPRLLGAAVLVLVGLLVIRAAVPELVFAQHGDWWLLFALLPLGVGIYRLHTRSGPTMGPTEAVVTVGVIATGAWLILAKGNPELSAVALTFTGVMLLYGAMPFFYSFDPASGPSRVATTERTTATLRPLLWVAAVTAVAVGVVLLLAPVQAAHGVGTVAVLLLGSMLFAAIAAAIVVFAERTRPPRILAAFRIKRTPMFLFLLAWALLAGAAATGASNNVPILAADDGTVAPVTVDDVWRRWLDRNQTAGGDEATRPAVPLVLVASSGGGLRAAVWTGYVLDCVFAGTIDGVAGCPGSGDTFGHVAVMSGVSGGALGLAAFSGAQTQEGITADEDWVKERLGDDYLAAAMAWLLLVDTPRTFVGFGPGIRDRAELMEQTWRRSWEAAGDPGFLARGMFDIWRTEPDLPLMVFNGTSVNDPCRFNLSVLDANAHPPGATCTSLEVFEGSSTGVDPSAALAATQDLADYLCPDQDLGIATAALMSARFPVVSPSGRIGEELADCEDGAPRAAYVVDGGYLEGSAAGTVTELWDQIEARVEAINADPVAGMCIVPFVIQIDNGYENPGASAGSAAPREAFVPLATLIGSQFGRIANAREQVAIEFDLPLEAAGEEMVIVTAGGEVISSRYARLTTRAHPGVQAPLGWTLSDSSIDDLRNQLEITENQKELAEIARWLSGDLECIG